MLNKFIPNLYRTYISNNLIMLNPEKNKNLSDYITFRPEKFIRLVIEKLEEQKEYDITPTEKKKSHYI